MTDESPEVVEAIPVEEEGSDLPVAPLPPAGRILPIPPRGFTPIPRYTR